MNFDQHETRVLQNKIGAAPKNARGFPLRGALNPTRQPTSPKLRWEEEWSLSRLPASAVVTFKASYFSRSVVTRASGYVFYFSITLFLCGPTKCFCACLFRDMHRHGDYVLPVCQQNTRYCQACVGARYRATRACGPNSIVKNGGTPPYRNLGHSKKNPTVREADHTFQRAKHMREYLAKMCYL